MEDDQRNKAYTYVAYASVIFSAVSILSVCITMPMVYNYVQHIRDKAKIDLEQCKSSAKDIMGEAGNFK